MKTFYIKSLVLTICLILALANIHTNVILANQDQSTTEKKLSQKELGDSLLVAARQGDSAKVSKLLAQGADVNFQDEYDWAAITIATALNHKDVVATLIKAGANVDILTEESFAFTPLKMAIFMGHKDIVQMLVNAGADVNATNDRKSEKVALTPLFFLMASDYKQDTYTDVLKILLNAGANPNPAKGEYNEGFITPLMAATSLGNVEAVKLLIEYGANVNYKTPEGITACFIAEKRNQQEMIDVLKMADAKSETNKSKNNKNNKNNKLNSDKIELPIMQYVGDVCFIPNFGPIKQTDKPLDIISKCEGKKIIDINVQDENGYTLLMSALITGEYSEEYVKYLIKSGINLELKNNDGETAFLVAAGNNKYSLTTIRTFLTAGANVNARNSNGQTVLMAHVMRCQGHESPFMTYKSLYDCSQIIKLLVAAGADINAQDKDGKTALMYAFELENESNVFFLTKALLDAGADPNIKDNDGVSLSDVLGGKNLSEFSEFEEKNN